MIQTVLEQGLCDQLVVTLRPGYFGGYRCMTDQLQRGMVSLQNISVASVGGDIVVHGQLQRGGAGTTDLNAMRAPVALIRERGQKIAKLLRLLFAGAILFSSVLIIVCGILRL